MDAAAPQRPAASRHALAAAMLFAWLTPAAAADFQLDNLKFDLGALVISVPKVEVKGSTLEREAFSALFSAASGESAVSRIGKLNASEISAPELKMEQTIGPQKQVTIYRSVRFSDIRDGKIGRAEAAGGSVTANLPAEMTTPPPSPGGALNSAAKAIAGGGGAGQTMRGEFLRMSFEAFDLTQLARVMTEKAKPGIAEPMLPIMGRYELDGYTFDLGPVGKMSLGKNSGRGFAAKVGDEPLWDVFTKLAAMSEKAAKEPGSKAPGFKTDEERKLGLAMLSLFETVSYGSGEARDFVMSVVAPPKTDAKSDAKPAPGAKPEMVDFRINRIAFGEDTPAKSGFSIEGMSFAGGGGKGQIDLISHSGFSIGPVIAALKEELAKVGGDFDSIDFRRFIPTIGTIRFSGIAIDAPQEARRGQPAPAPMKIGIGVFELKSGDQINGIPTSLSLTIDNLLAPVVETPGNPTARDLLAMGYRNLDLSGKLDLAWDAAKSEIGIKALSLGGAGMARFDAKGTLGNVTKDLFASDMALAQVAALGATARSVEAKLQNLGLFEKLLENEARKAKRKPEEMRQQYAMMANLGLSAILGPSEGAKALTAAISRFVAKPGTLSVSATAKSAGGLGLADVITLTDPTEIFDKIDIKANAE
jgi:hypothetical protein